MTAVMGQQTVPPATSTSSSSIPADYIEWHSPLFGVVISQPPDWERRPIYDSPRGYSLAHFFSPEGERGVFTGDRPNFNVEVAEESGAMADYEARAWLEQRASELMTVHETFQIIESAPTTLAGQPVWMLRYTFTNMMDNSEVTHMQVTGGVAGRTYLLTYSSPANLFDEYLPDVQNMINSFRVQSATTPSTTSTPSTTTTRSPPSSSTTLFQITEDSFSVQTPQGWIIQDVNNTGAALSEEAGIGYGLLAELCPEEEQQSAAISTNTSRDVTYNTSSNNTCQTTQGEVVHIIRYPDLVTRIQPANNITAYHLDKLREVGYTNIQIVNSTNLTVNVTNPLTNETVTIEPAKFVEMTYSTASGPSEARRGYFILTATNWTAPYAGTIKGYSVFYEGNSTNSTAAARPGLVTTLSLSSDSLVTTPLPPAVAQLFDTFELILAPEVAQVLAQQGATQDQPLQVTNTTVTNATQIAEPTEISETEEVDDGDDNGGDEGDGDEEPEEEPPEEEEPPDDGISEE